MYGFVDSLFCQVGERRASERRARLAQGFRDIRCWDQLSGEGCTMATVRRGNKAAVLVVDVQVGVMDGTW
ncbi:MAG: hypothetical protein ACP5HZ_03355, partial [Ferrimicrobium sp.]